MADNESRALGKVYKILLEAAARRRERIRSEEMGKTWQEMTDAELEAALEQLSLESADLSDAIADREWEGSGADSIRQRKRMVDEWIHEIALEIERRERGSSPRE